MMNDWILGLVAFVITVAETYVSSKTTQAIASRRKVHAANWNSCFEMILLVDILLVVANWKVVAIPILLGAWIGMYWSFSLKE